ncbi:hypothetical protein [Shouchella clausii]|uniref:Uncharacterized protein n=1 Tax=Shouchella clausii TaxID=79880 RepID=A0A268NYR3_SHOCL|nr:hypothetical protein [Shouchella clausii]PAE88657.1 hypothetical protein CHH72_11820 [Shouchella clausii]
MGGTWVATSGYIDGEATGEPDCGQFALGMRFVDEKNLFVGEPGEEEAFEYEIRDEIDSYGEERRFIEFFHVTRKEEHSKRNPRMKCQRECILLVRFRLKGRGRMPLVWRYFQGNQRGVIAIWNARRVSDVPVSA